jgi:hypothetical protein
MWAGQEASKLMTVLAHLRRVQDPVKAAEAMGKMSMQEKAQFMDVIALMAPKSNTSSSASSVASISRKDESLKRRVLNRNVSEDSDGFPAMLKKGRHSHEHTGNKDKGELGHKVLGEKRDLLHMALLHSSLSAAFTLPESNSSSSVGIVAGPKAKVTKTQAKAKTKAQAKAGGLGLGKSLVGGNMTFSALRLVTASNPPRTYMQGQVAGSKSSGWKLIVEVTASSMAQHREVMERILKEVQSKSISKLAACQLRDKYAPRAS